MSSSVQPASASYAKLHIWETTATIAAIGGIANDKFQILPDNYFALFAIVASTNYDSFAGEWKAANVNGGAALMYGPPRVPNNFSVQILQDNEKRFGGAVGGAGIPQAVIASSGYMAGHQLPFPSIYAPLTTFQFQFTNTAPVLLNDNAGSPAAIDLQIRLGFYGYNIPNEFLETFCGSWPAYQAEALKKQAGWLSRFTNMPVGG
jgi:hypothetical protein